MPQYPPPNTWVMDSATSTTLGGLKTALDAKLAAMLPLPSFQLQGPITFMYDGTNFVAAYTFQYYLAS